MKTVVVTNQVRSFNNGFKIMIEPLLELGYEVIWVANFSKYSSTIDEIPCRVIDVPIQSNPFKFGNFKAYKKLLKLFKEESVELVHCTTPIGGLLGRLSAFSSGVPNIIYTAHGFHFYEGAPLLNNTLIKKGEEYLAKKTNVLITINEEDYNSAKFLSLRNPGKLYLTHGAGITIDTTNHNKAQIKYEIRKSLDIPLDATVLISAGDLNKNKNNQIIIEAIDMLNNKDIYYLICGEGKLSNEIQNKIKSLNLNNNVKLLGFRRDIPNLLMSSDIFVMPSYREGLPRSVMEAMVYGLPCIVSDIRGARDLIKDNNGGFVCRPNDSSCFASKIQHLHQNKKVGNKFGEYNKIKVSKYSFDIVKEEQKQIYKSLQDTL